MVVSFKKIGQGLENPGKLEDKIYPLHGCGYGNLDHIFFSFPPLGYLDRNGSHRFTRTCHLIHVAASIRT